MVVDIQVAETFTNVIEVPGRTDTSQTAVRQQRQARPRRRTMEPGLSPPAICPSTWTLSNQTLHTACLPLDGCISLVTLSASGSDT